MSIRKLGEKYPIRNVRRHIGDETQEQLRIIKKDLLPRKYEVKKYKKIITHQNKFSELSRSEVIKWYNKWTVGPYKENFIYKDPQILFNFIQQIIRNIV